MDRTSAASSIYMFKFKLMYCRQIQVSCSNSTFNLKAQDQVPNDVTDIYSQSGV